MEFVDLGVQVMIARSLLHSLERRKFADKVITAQQPCLSSGSSIWRDKSFVPPLQDEARACTADAQELPVSWGGYGSLSPRFEDNNCSLDDDRGNEEGQMAEAEVASEGEEKRCRGMQEASWYSLLQDDDEEQQALSGSTAASSSISSSGGGSGTCYGATGTNHWRAAMFGRRERDVGGGTAVERQAARELKGVGGSSSRNESLHRWVLLWGASFRGPAAAGEGSPSMLPLQESAESPLYLDEKLPLHGPPAVAAI